MCIKCISNVDQSAESPSNILLVSGHFGQFWFSNLQLLLSWFSQQNVLSKLALTWLIPGGEVKFSVWDGRRPKQR